jgi:hypothetical protein
MYQIHLNLGVWDGGLHVKRGMLPVSACVLTALMYGATTELV